jgi:DNA-binding transcriptional LysR family regulator
MTSPKLSWDVCQSFLAVLRDGNLSRAARALQLTQPTIGRHIEEIEHSLGVSLFVRSPQGLSPTDAAFDLRPHAEAMAAAADALLRTASGSAGDTTGTIRITAPEILGAEALPPILTEFRNQYPGIIIELALTHRTEDLLRREADIAVRMVRPTQNALVARKVGDVRFSLYAHRAYLDRYGAPETVEALSRHSLIGFDKGMVFIRPLLEANTPLVHEALSFRSDNALAQLAAIRAGFGIGGCPQAIARRDPNLVPVLANLYDVKVDLWVAMHEDERSNRRMRLMFDHLAAALKAFTSLNVSGKEARE